MVEMLFGKWRPDLPFDHPEPHLRDAKNAVPMKVGYMPAFAPAAYTSGQSTLTSSEKVIGASPDGLHIGTETKLCRLSGTADVSRTVGGAYTASYSNGDRWSFCKGPNGGTIATNFVDAVQEIGITAGGNFGALGGSPPQARHCFLAEDFVFLCSLNSDTKAIQWSSKGNPEEWTPGTNLGDTVTFQGDDPVTCGFYAGRGVIYIFQENAIHRGLYVGLPKIWQFETIYRAENIGVPYQGWGGMVGRDATVYFMTSQGDDFMPDFVRLSPDGSLQSIASGHIREWLHERSANSFMPSVSATFDLSGEMVMWSIPTSTNNSIVYYNIAADKWGYSEMDVHQLGHYPYVDSGYQETIVGGFIGRYQTATLMGSYNDAPGDELDMELETSRRDVSDGRVVQTRGGRFLHGPLPSGVLSGALGSALSSQDDIVFDSERTIEDSGFLPGRVTGRHLALKAYAGVPSPSSLNYDSNPFLGQTKSGVWGFDLDIASARGNR